MIRQITRACVRTYSDNHQSIAIVEWLSRSGKPGRTEGTAESRDFERQEVKAGEDIFYVDSHMAALLSRAQREGVAIEREVW